MYKATIAAIFVLLSVVTISFADPCKLAWDYNDPPSDLAGFRFYESTTPTGPFTLIATALPTAREVTTECRDNTYVVATAYDRSDRESGHSNQVNMLIAPPSPNNLRVMFSININIPSPQ